jgi:hypothetical protein
MRELKIISSIIFLTHLVSSQNSCPEYHQDYIGTDIAYLPTASANECQKYCQANNQCKFWTWGIATHPNPNIANLCYFKGSKGSVITNYFTISGPKNCPGRVKLT